MDLRTYRAATLAEAVAKVKAELGHNALILHTRQIVERYGPGELGWLSRKLSGLPDSLARLGVRVIVGSEAARRRIVFDSIFGMREVAS